MRIVHHATMVRREFLVELPWKSPLLRADDTTRKRIETVDTLTIMTPQGYEVIASFDWRYISVLNPSDSPEMTIVIQSRWVRFWFHSLQNRTPLYCVGGIVNPFGASPCGLYQKKREGSFSKLLVNEIAEGISRMIADAKTRRRRLSNENEEMGTLQYRGEEILHRLR